MKFLPTFAKANASALIATVVDFSTLVGCVEILSIHYVQATTIGAVLGALTNFTVNRIWAFNQRTESPLTQGLKYAVVSAGSLVLNTALVYIITESKVTPYWGAKILAAVLVGWFWNYPLHRYVVFKKRR